MLFKRGEYILNVQGENLTLPAGTATQQPTDLLHKDFPTLKDAFGALQSLNERMFVDELAKRDNLPWNIHAAGIVSKGRVLAIKRQLIGFENIQLPNGVYLQIITPHISLQDFQQQTGFPLSNFKRTGKNTDYFLLAETAQLKQLPQDTEPLTRKKLPPDRQINPDNRKGLSP